MAQSNTRLRRCPACATEKPLADFSRDSTGPDGIRRRCRVCCSASRRARYKALSESPDTKAELLRKSLEWKHDNREKIREYSRKWRAKQDPEKLRDAARLHGTGVTPQQYQAALTQQRFRCKICGKHRDDQVRSLAADHCHSTGVFRGVLCDNCNHGLGKFKDKPDLLRAAADYLEAVRG